MSASCSLHKPCSHLVAIPKQLCPTPATSAGKAPDPFLHRVGSSSSSNADPTIETCLLNIVMSNAMMNNAAAADPGRAIVSGLMLPDAATATSTYLEHSTYLPSSTWPNLHVNVCAVFPCCRPLLNEATLPDVTNCGVNVPSPDMLTPQRSAAAIWTWAPAHPYAPWAEAAMVTRMARGRSARWALQQAAATAARLWARMSGDDDPGVRWDSSASRCTIADVLVSMGSRIHHGRWLLKMLLSCCTLPASPFVNVGGGAQQLWTERQPCCHCDGSGYLASVLPTAGSTVSVWRVMEVLFKCI